MSDKNYAEEVFSLTKKAISGKKDELGYLSLTGKPEGPIRDRVSWLFQQKYPNLIAAREYKRYDLAILDPNEDSNKKAVKHIFEFKVGSAVSFRKDLKKAKDYVNRVITDFKKGRKNGDLKKLTSIFIGVEPYKYIDKNKMQFIKYAKRSNPLWNKGEENEPEETFVYEKMVAYFKEKEVKGFECKDYYSVELEEFEGIGVRLHLLLLKPDVEYFEN